MRKKVVLAFIVLCILSAYGFAAEDNTTIDVSIGSLSEITVFPEYLTWTNVTLGTTGGEKLLDIINTGSENITLLYAYIDTLTDEISRPYGSSNAADYAAGGTIVIRNETGWEPDNNTFAGRIEWNWTEEVSNSDLSNLSSQAGWGFFKNASQEYFWGISNGTNGLCNETGAQFAIDDDRDTGAASTRTPLTTDIPFDGTVDGSGWGIFSVNRETSPLNGSCVAVNYSCENIYIYKYDKRSPFSTCTNSRYIKFDSLIPSEIHTLNVDVYMPKGLPVGNMTTATLTLVAS